MTKTCKQCGVIKPTEQFRSYYGGRKGTYTTCRSCERINSRVKYLESKAKRSEEEIEELNTIYKLWDTQRKLGLQPPRSMARDKQPVFQQAIEMLELYNNQLDHLTIEVSGDAPQELIKWLSEPLVEEPDYYLDEIYEGLKTKYQPIIQINTTNMMPIYDKAYSSILDKILERFYEYEDSYYEEEK